MIWWCLDALLRMLSQHKYQQWCIKYTTHGFPKYIFSMPSLVINLKYVYLLHCNKAWAKMPHIFGEQIKRRMMTTFQTGSYCWRKPCFWSATDVVSIKLCSKKQHQHPGQMLARSVWFCHGNWTRATWVRTKCLSHWTAAIVSDISWFEQIKIHITKHVWDLQLSEELCWQCWIFFWVINFLELNFCWHCYKLNWSVITTG